MVKHDDVYAQREDASRRAAARLLTAIGSSLERLDRFIVEVPDDEHHIRSITIKMRFDDVGDILLMVKADSGSGPKIAFQAAESVAACITGIVNRLDNGSVKWREDLPYEQRHNNA